MRTPARLLVIFLGLTTATSVFYAYQQNKSLKAARQLVESLERERSVLRERLNQAGRDTVIVQGAADTAAETGASSASRPEVEPASPLPAPGEIPVGGLGRLPQLLENPEAQRLMAVQQRGALDQRYGALFRYLNLPPDQLERLKDLLVERQTAAVDVLAAARSQGLNNRENRGEIRSLLEAAQAEVDESIRALLGESGYQRYQYYNATQPQRAAVDRLEQRLSYSTLPLSHSQSEQLVQLLAAKPSSRTATVAARPGLAGMFGGQATTITDEVVTQAATILSAVQLEALRQLQAEQQAQARLGQLVRENRGNRNATPAPNPGTPPRG